MDDLPKSAPEKLQEIIDSSDLSIDDRELITEHVPSLPLEVQEVLVNACEQDPSFLEEMVDNLKMKLEAGDDKEKLHEIIERERNEITNILNED